MITRRITASFLKVPKKARTAFIVSLVLPGSGHIYNRELVRGVFLWAISAGFALWFWLQRLQYDAQFQATLEQTGLADIAAAQARAAVPYPWLPLVFYGLVAVYAAYDSYLVARQVIDLIERERLIREAERRDMAAKGAAGGGLPHA